MPIYEYFIETIPESFPGTPLEKSLIAVRKRIYDAWKERHTAQDETMNVQITGNAEVRK